MKHPIEQSFDKQTKENPDHSSYINFVRAIKGRGYERGLVLRMFRKLVDKEDWSGVPFDEVAKNLMTTRQKTLIPSHPDIGRWAAERLFL